MDLKRELANLAVDKSLSELKPRQKKKKLGSSEKWRKQVQYLTTEW